MNRPLAFVTVLAVVVLSACGDTGAPSTSSIAPGGTMQLTSPAFSHNGSMPARFTCQGDDVSPPLEITGVPDGAISLVLLVDDPDAPDPAAPKMVWDHWILWNIAADTATIPEGSVPPGAVQGVNSWKRNDYGGPCPPIGTHRYFFKLYALDGTLALPSSAIKADVETAMQGHILAGAELIGLYGK